MLASCNVESSVNLFSLELCHETRSAPTPHQCYKNYSITQYHHDNNTLSELCYAIPILYVPKFNVDTFATLCNTIVIVIMIVKVYKKTTALISSLCTARVFHVQQTNPPLTFTERYMWPRQARQTSIHYFRGVTPC